LPYYRATPGAALRLFCFPYAGGGASLFRGWSDALPRGVELCAVQLPGRENRLGEPAFTRMEPLVEALGRELGPFLDRPFALFGHSMGGRIAFELARLARREHGREPVHLFASACRAPQIPNDDNRTHRLSDDEFIEVLRRLQGVPEAVLDNVELREIFLPVLRSDFTLFETTTYREEGPLCCPITAFGGLLDRKLERFHIEGWREQTVGAFDVQMLRGDHFYVQSERDLLLQFIGRVLRPIARNGPG